MRYRSGGTSGEGSYGRQAEYKAAFLNAFVKANGVKSVAELGSGDGNQLRLAKYPSYIGVDVSRTAIAKCIEAFRDDPSKSFRLYDPKTLADLPRFIHADLAISLDVVFHLVEDHVYERYMRILFAAADRFVIVYGNERDERTFARHVKHRLFTQWVAEHAAEWALLHTELAPNPELKEFRVFTRRAADGRPASQLPN